MNLRGIIILSKLNVLWKCMCVRAFAQSHTSSHSDLKFAHLFLFVWMFLLLLLTGAEKGEPERMELGDSYSRFVSPGGGGPPASRMSPSLCVLFRSYFRALPRFLSFLYWASSTANLGGVSCCP